MDVIEHLEDYIGCLKLLKTKSCHKVFHVPLDLSLQGLARGVPLKVKKFSGHLHYFTRQLFLSMLEDCGYRIVDWFYTGAATDIPDHHIRRSLARWPRKFLFRIHQDTAALVLGGYSLLVLAE